LLQLLCQVRLPQQDDERFQDDAHRHREKTDHPAIIAALPMNQRSIKHNTFPHSTAFLNG
jgi:hypothetical protein